MPRPGAIARRGVHCSSAASAPEPRPPATRPKMAILLLLLRFAPYLYLSPCLWNTSDHVDHYYYQYYSRPGTSLAVPERCASVHTPKPAAPAHSVHCCVAQEGMYSRDTFLTNPKNRDGVLYSPGKKDYLSCVKRCSPFPLNAVSYVMMLMRGIHSVPRAVSRKNKTHRSQHARESAPRPKQRSLV